MSREEADSALGAAAAKLLGDRRLIIATNRGPVSFASSSDGSLRARRGSGGLVTALAHVSRHVPVTWVAAAMGEGDRRAAADPALLRRAAGEGAALRLRFAVLDRAVYDQAYNVIANPLLWFLQHQMWNLPERPVIDASVMRAWERGYVALNEAFASVVVHQAGRDRRPRIMLHDYHLYLAAEPIRRARPRAILSHFTHIPWPPSSIWQTISPVIRETILRGLLANDVVGFQTERYAHNFLRSVESFLPDATVDHDARQVRRAGRTTRVRHYPISIDVEATLRVARSQAARRRADELLARARGRVIVRVDRMEPSKNILRGFLAYEALLQRHPRLRGEISFMAFLVPSRTSLREYGYYARRVQDVVDRINGRFGTGDWRPVQLFYENDYAQGLAAMSIADVVLVNPLIDGMNLVAKEAVVVSQRDAALVLSETAGAFDQMAAGSLPVAPADVLGTADALATGLRMPVGERRRRLRAMVSGVEREDITWWLRRQFEDLAELDR
ncbi:MAG: trehalose-6-phosphate synthase [Chloroflexi bacterium]|nr:trehalose-6-phosphate synthase [Chloroflexota bacterium]